MGDLILKQDKHGAPIPKGTGGTTIDASSTPKQSPQTVSNTEVELVVPVLCGQLVIKSTEKVWVDFKTGAGSAQGFSLDPEKNCMMVIDVEPAQVVYLIRDSADASVEFYFVRVAGE